MPCSEPDMWEEWGELLEIMNVPPPLEGQVRAADPEHGCLPGDGGETMALNFPSEPEPALIQVWELTGKEKKVEQKEPSSREVILHTPANL